MKVYIPQTKDDLQAIDKLRLLSFEVVKGDAGELLSWMQDMHWEVAHDIADYLRPFVNEIKSDLINILDTNDNEWKFAILTFLIARSNKKLDSELIQALNRIYQTPRTSEIDDELNTIARDIIGENAKPGRSK